MVNLFPSTEQNIMSLQSNQVQNNLELTNENTNDIQVNSKVSPENNINCEQLISDYLKKIYPDISFDELAIYDDAELKLENVDGRVCLTQPEIDLDYKDAMGRTNLERMQDGLSPINPKDGLPYELHHVGQKNDAPLAELTHSQHMSSENNTTLHPIRSGSEVDHGYSWKDVRESHWKARAEQLINQQTIGA